MSKLIVKVIVSGPTGAGKTIVAEDLYRALAGLGYGVECEDDGLFVGYCLGSGNGLPRVEITTEQTSR